MWFEDRSWSNLKMSSMIVEEWRDLWSYKGEFLGACFAYVFATTNFLNLPKLVLDNGGLAFLAAYGVALLVVVLPVLVMELTVGQLTGRAPVQALYNMSPVFKGVGVAQIVFSLLVLATMARYLAWLFLYMFHLFWSIVDERPGLPWLHCKNFPELQTRPCREAGAILNISAAGAVKLSTMHDESALSQFMRALENPSNSVAEFGDFQYYILAAQGLVWILVFLSLCFGVRWLGKVVTANFLAAFTGILVCAVYALFLKGSLDVFVRLSDLTDWRLLQDYHVWKLAVEQAVLATGIGFGAFITLGSYIQKENNLVRDAFLTLLVHCLLTALQLTLVFGVAGFVAVRTGLEPAELIERGEAQMWNFLSYMSYLSSVKLFSGIVIAISILTIISIFHLLSLNILSSLEDALGSSWTRCCPRFFLALVTALLGFGTGIYFTTQAGKYAYELATGSMRVLTLWTILAMELFAVAWFYCAHSLGKDLRTLLRSTCCWCLGHFLLYFTYLLPFIPLAVAVLNVIAYSYDAFSEQVRKFEYSELVGLTIALLPLLPIPLLALVAFCASCRTPGLTKAQRFRAAFKSPLHYEVIKSSDDSVLSSSHRPTPRYVSSSPGYVLLPQHNAHNAPLAEPETYNEQTRNSLEVKLTDP